MQRRTLPLLVSISIVFVIAFFLSVPMRVQSASRQLHSVQAPSFTHTKPDDWLNSSPLKLADLQGKVVLVEFWTFDCINCKRSIPWMKAAQAKYAGKDFAIVSVHTPELPEEKNRRNIVEAVKKLGITYPVMIDLDFTYWNALENEYWPAFYLIDKTGVVRERVIGELHVGERRAEGFEKRLEALL